MCTTGNWFKMRVAVKEKCLKINILWSSLFYFFLSFFFLFAKGLIRGKEVGREGGGRREVGSRKGGREGRKGFERGLLQAHTPIFSHMPLRKFLPRCIVGQEERRLS